jgi:hypothetical protein
MKLNWAWFNITIKNLICVSECDGEDGRAVNLKTQGCGFYPHIGQNFGGSFLHFFPHTFINLTFIRCWLKPA